MTITFRRLCEQLVQAWDDTEGQEYDDFGRAAEHIVAQARELLDKTTREQPKFLRENLERFWPFDLEKRL